MKYILIILLLFPFITQATRVNMTVSGGNINNLANAQSSYGIGPGDTLAIPVTLSGYCGIGGLTGTRAQPIVVVVNGRVTPYQLEIGNAQFVKFYFKLSDSTSGMVITGAGRALVMNGVKVQNCSWHGIRIPNPADYPFLAYHSRTFAGNLDSTNHNLLFDSLEVYGGGALIDCFNFNNNNTSYLRGLWDSITFRNCYIHDMQGGNIWSIQHYFHGYWKNITVTRTGTIDTRHVAVMHFGDGSGVIDGCYFKRIYGDGIRFKAGTSLVSNKNQPLDTAKVINCKFVDFTKYAGVECNSDANTYDTSSQWIRGVNYIISNNNMGRFNDSDYVDAGVGLDIYVHHGFIWFTNHLGWDSHRDKAPGANPYWHIGDGSPAPNDTTGCRYTTASNALSLYLQDTVQAVTKLNSIGNRIGKKLPHIVSGSYNGQDREFSIQYDIGAYQWTGRSIFTFRKGFLITSN